MLLNSYIQKLRGKSVQDISKYARDELLRKLSTTTPFADILYTVLPVPNPKKWVFIVGCYNSGTSLLLKTLASHPTISSLDEGASFTKQLITPEELGWTRMWSQVVDKIRLMESNSPPDVTKLKQDWGLHLDSQKDIFIEKSIVNSFRMKWLQQNFKDAHFISIVRNGYAVAEGIQRKVRKRNGVIPSEYGDTYPIELCAKQWVVNNQIIEQDSSDIPAFKRLFYEDFCRDPQPIVDAADTLSFYNYPLLSEVQNKKRAVHD